ncbi:MAG: zf-HC2 domain-containing protein [Anaerolineae bacterium]|nr:zf-HC2 domain-containing protein [Anaerolineae bacterium]
MRDRHVTHLLTRYVHGQLSLAQEARVANHVRTCARCRAALAHEERVARDLRDELAVIGRQSAAPVAAAWAGVWREVRSPRSRARALAALWLPGLSLALAIALALAGALPLLAGEGVRAEAAPQQPRPIVMASPTPGVTETVEAYEAGGYPGALPLATVALAGQVGASPAPMPQATVSPQAALGAAH